MKLLRQNPWETWEGYRDRLGDFLKTNDGKTLLFKGATEPGPFRSGKIIEVDGQTVTLKDDAGAILVYEGWMVVIAVKD